MKNNSQSDTNLTDRDPLSTHKLFKHIIQATENHWISLDPIPDTYSLVGHMTARNKRSIRVILSCIKRNHQENRVVLRLQSTVADHIQKESKTFYDLLSRANAAYSNAKAIYEFEQHHVIAQSNADCSTHVDDIAQQIGYLFKDFACLINDDTLYAAITSAQGHLLGTPIDLWLHE